MFNIGMSGGSEILDILKKEKKKRKEKDLVI